MKKLTQKSIQKKHVLSSNFKRFRTGYEPHERVQVFTKDARTQQDHADQCDINKILSNYIKTGVLSHQRDNHDLQYGDVSGYDFEKAQNIVATAKTLFEELPALVRARFNHSPAQFLDFAGDENNMEEMVEMGLASTPKREVEPEHVEALAETVAPDEGADKELST